MRNIKILLILCCLMIADCHAVSLRKRLRARRLHVPTQLVFETSNATHRFSPERIAQYQSLREQLNSYNQTLFNLQFLKRAHDVRALICSSRDTICNGSRFCLKAKDQYIYGTFFNRKSPYLVCITGGFSNAHEYMAPFLALLPDYNLVFFDLPGHGIDQQTPVTYKGKIAFYLSNVNVEQIDLAEKESFCIQAVVNHFRSQAFYKTVVGIGRCYSAHFFARAAADWQKDHEVPLFDKLIIDSAFEDFKTMVPNFPALFCSRSNAPLLRDLSTSWPIKKTFLSLTSYFLQKDIADLPCLSSFLSQLPATDLFFIHSLADIAISAKDFQQIWQRISHIENKAVLYTFNKHALNHIKQKEVYAWLTRNFIEKSFDGFIHTISKESQ